MSIILYGSYYLPPSVNELYVPMPHKNGLSHFVKSYKAREYQENLQAHLSYPDTRFELWIDEIGVRLVREQSAIARLKKHMKAHQKPIYELEVLCVFATDASDVDGRHKAIQDTLANWLGINDNRIYRIIEHKTLGETPHVQFVFRQLSQPIHNLLERVKQEFTPTGSFYTQETIA